MNLMNKNLNNIQGVIFDFDGVFTDNFVYTSEDGIEFVKCSKLDGIGLSFLDKLNIPAVVISSETNPVVSKRCEKLKINVIQGVYDKVVAAKNWANQEGISLANVCFLGNDVNDEDLLHSVGNPFLVSDAVPHLLSQGFQVLSARGGNGAVRELCEMIWRDFIMNLDEIWKKVIPEVEDMGARPWGKEEVLAVASNQIMMKRLFIRAGTKGGLQYHRKRVEAGYIVSGKMIVRLGLDGEIEEKVLKSGDHFIFPTGLVHQEEAIDDTIIIECSTPWINDRVRVEKEFGLGEPEGMPTTAPGEETLL